MTVLIITSHLVNKKRQIHKFKHEKDVLLVRPEFEGSFVSHTSGWSEVVIVCWWDAVLAWWRLYKVSMNGNKVFVILPDWPNYDWKMVILGLLLPKKRCYIYPKEDFNCYNIIVWFRYCKWTLHNANVSTKRDIFFAPIMVLLLLPKLVFVYFRYMTMRYFSRGRNNV